MDSIVLFDYRDARIWIHVWAYIQDDKIVIAGQDIDCGGGAVTAYAGSSEYEYFRSLSVEDTQTLYGLLKKETRQDKELLVLIHHCFAGKEAVSGFVKYCEQKGMAVAFYSC